MQKFDDARIYDNVLFALVSADKEVIQKFEKLAEGYRERFYFFHMQRENGKTQESVVYSVTAHSYVAHKVSSRSNLEAIVLRS
jgi:hypothetical protein